MNRVTYDDAAKDLIHGYETNKGKSVYPVRLRLRKHLAPVSRSVG